MLFMGRSSRMVLSSVNRSHIDNQPGQSYINHNIWIIVRQSSYGTIIQNGLPFRIIVHYFLIYLLSSDNRPHIDNQPRQSYINLNIWIIVRQSSHETIIPHGLSFWIIVHYFLIYVLSSINRPHNDNQPGQSYINL